MKSKSIASKVSDKAGSARAMSMEGKMLEENNRRDKETAPRICEGLCEACGEINPVWFADNEVWNAVFPERTGYVCPNCFIKLADPIVPNTGWKLVPEVAVECTAQAPTIHKPVFVMADEWHRKYGNTEDFWTVHDVARFAEFFAAECTAQAPTQPGVETDYYWKDGSLKWGHPVNVEHLILQLQTLDPKMKVSSVHHVPLKEGKKARAFGLSMSRERWDEAGWLDWRLDGPECLAIWAQPNEHVQGTNPEAATPQGTPTCNAYIGGPADAKCVLPARHTGNCHAISPENAPQGTPTTQKEK